MSVSWSNLEKTPARRLVAEGWIDRDSGRAPAGQPEGELVERERKPEAARLDISLLERPVRKECFALLLDGQQTQSCCLGGREKAVGNVRAFYRTIDGFGIDANMTIDCYRAGDQAVGVCQIEIQPHGVDRRLDLRLAVGANVEGPGLRFRVVILRQDSPDQCTRDEKAELCRAGPKFVVAGMFLGRHKTLIFLDQVRTTDPFGNDVPQMRFVRRQQQGHSRRLMPRVSAVSSGIEGTRPAPGSTRLLPPHRR